MFRKRREGVDQSTGEILPAPWYESAVDVSKAKKVSDLTPNRPRFINLRDNEWLDGVQIAICRIDFQAGDYGSYARIGGFILRDGKPDEPVLIMTSSEDVYDRCLRLQDYVNDGNVVVGTLRQVGKSGQAWILD